jgi:hypothetical protein
MAAKEDDRGIRHTHPGGDRPHAHEGVGTSTKGETVQGPLSEEHGAETTRVPEENAGARKRPTEDGERGLVQEVENILERRPAREAPRKRRAATKVTAAAGQPGAASAERRAHPAEQGAVSTAVSVNPGGRHGS